MTPSDIVGRAECLVAQCFGHVRFAPPNGTKATDAPLLYPMYRRGDDQVILMLWLLSMRAKLAHLFRL